MISFEVNIKDSSLLLLNEFNFYSSGIVGKSMVLASKGLNMRNKEVKFVDRQCFIGHYHSGIVMLAANKFIKKKIP